MLRFRQFAFGRAQSLPSLLEQFVDRSDLFFQCATSILCGRQPPFHLSQFRSARNGLMRGIGCDFFRGHELETTCAELACHIRSIPSEKGTRGFQEGRARRRREMSSTMAGTSMTLCASKEAAGVRPEMCLISSRMSRRLCPEPEARL